MSSDFPSLPNEAPVEDMASESAPVELDPPEVAAPPEPLPAPVVASRPVIRKPEPAPRMPAMPGEPAAADDDDDDFEILTRRKSNASFPATSQRPRTRRKGSSRV